MRRNSFRNLVKRLSCPRENFAQINVNGISNSQQRIERGTPHIPLNETNDRMREARTLSYDGHGEAALFALLFEEANHVGGDGVSQVLFCHALLIRRKGFDNCGDKSHSRRRYDGGATHSTAVSNSVLVRRPRKAGEELLQEGGNFFLGWPKVVGNNTQSPCQTEQFKIGNPSQLRFDLGERLAAQVPSPPTATGSEHRLGKPLLVAQAANLRADDVSRIAHVPESERQRRKTEQTKGSEFRTFFLANGRDSAKDSANQHENWTLIIQAAWKTGAGHGGNQADALEEDFGPP